MENITNEQSTGLEVVNIRLVREPTLYSEKEIRSPLDAVELMRKELASYDREVLCVVNMKSNGEPINMNIVGIGTINSCLACGREIFKSVVLTNAASFLLFHNHPSGSVEPSQDDIRLTRYMAVFGRMFGAHLLDHIIIGGETGEYYSFKNGHIISEQKVSQWMTSVDLMLSRPERKEHERGRER